MRIALSALACIIALAAKAECWVPDEPMRSAMLKYDSDIIDLKAIELHITPDRLVSLDIDCAIINTEWQGDTLVHYADCPGSPLGEPYIMYAWVRYTSEDTAVIRIGNGPPNVWRACKPPRLG
jgi:hypothetical protein